MASNKAGKFGFLRRGNRKRASITPATTFFLAENLRPNLHFELVKQQEGSYFPVLCCFVG